MSWAHTPNSSATLSIAMFTWEIHRTMPPLVRKINNAGESAIYAELLRVAADIYEHDAAQGSPEYWWDPGDFWMDGGGEVFRDTLSEKCGKLARDLVRKGNAWIQHGGHYVAAALNWHPVSASVTGKGDMIYTWGDAAASRIGCPHNRRATSGR